MKKLKTQLNSSEIKNWEVIETLCKTKTTKRKDLNFTKQLKILQK